MNRASLLHILDHAGGISEAEVRELEQLAAAFPYCQTAHLLLAKAAHDRGSMLAGQRLRRAATYAADRELLRVLIERPAPELAPTAVSPTPPVASSAPDAAAAAVIAPAELVLAPAEPVADAVTPETTAATEPELTASDIEQPEAVNAPVEVTDATANEPLGEAATLEAAEATQPVEAEPETLAAVDATGAEVATEQAADVETAAKPVAEPETSFQTEAETSVAKTPAAEASADQPQTPEAAAPQSETGEPEAATQAPASTEVVTEKAEPESVNAERVLEAAEAVQTRPATEPVTEAAEAVAASVGSEIADTPAAVAEAPVEAAASAEPEVAIQTGEAAEPEVVTAVAAAEENTQIGAETAATAYTVLLGAGAAVLPVPLPATTASAESNDELPPAAPPIRPPVEAGSSRFEFGLGEAPEPLPTYQLPELPEEEPATPAGFPPFRADELLAYALSSGSRLGSALTLRTPELTTDLPLAASWPTDAAMLAHQAAHRPPPPPAPSSLALIDRFLRSQPRIKNAQRPAPTDSPQADLSVRSTSATPSLASESLAKIMVKQGKIGRAIEIYRQLMLRQPEKKAYFAAQIDLLNQPLE